MAPKPRASDPLRAEARVRFASLEQLLVEVERRQPDPRGDLPLDEHRAAVYVAAARYAELYRPALELLIGTREDDWTYRGAAELVFRALAEGEDDLARRAIDSFPSDAPARAVVERRWVEQRLVRRLAAGGSLDGVDFPEMSSWFRTHAAQAATSSAALDEMELLGSRRIRGLVRERRAELRRAARRTEGEG